MIIYVFGSNLAGRHGAGAALHAVEFYGAIPGFGEGPQGMAYAIPTKSKTLIPLSLAQIRKGVEKFIAYAKEHPEWKFKVTPIGCGLAGYRAQHIAPLFRGVPDNCDMPEGWRVFCG